MKLGIAGNKSSLFRKLSKARAKLSHQEKKVSGDVVGNIVILKFDRYTKHAHKKEVALRFMKENKSVSTVLDYGGKFSGRLRTHKTKWIVGDKTKEALYKENGCVFRFNVDTCYFSSRLGNERKELAEKVRKGERVLVMFGGVAPFAIVIGKMSEVKKVVSVELGKECNKYAKQNVKRNKLQDVIEIIQGDVRKRVPKLREKFDRIIMARPQLKDSFLDVALSKIGKGGVIHYYGFSPRLEPSPPNSRTRFLLNKKNSKASSPNSSIQFSLLRENTKLNTLTHPQKINNKSKDYDNKSTKSGSYDNNRKLSEELEKKDIRELRELILQEAKKARKKVKIQKIKKAGDVGPYRFRYRVDFRIL